MYKINILNYVDYLEKMQYYLKEEIHYKLNIEHYERGSKIFDKG